MITSKIQQLIQRSSTYQAQLYNRYAEMCERCDKSKKKKEKKTTSDKLFDDSAGVCSTGTNTLKDQQDIVHSIHHD